MALKLFNTLSRSVQEFTPLDPAGKIAGMYCCGPTVYDFAHIGNWRTFVFGDLVRRYLEFKGYAVTHVINITDIEDKIIKRVRETNTSLKEFTGKYEAEFVADLKTLNCRLPHQTPRATEFMGDIIALIAKLMQRGLAYQAADGSVYFSIDKYRGCGCTYGQLVKLNFDEMRVGDRVKSDDYAKESVADFALWKARVPEDGDIFWPSPWGDGRPGWHIECSAMSMKLLGPSFDLHLGGEDLVFPHHEDEIAQSEGAGMQAPGQRFVKHWLHGAHLLVEGKKMSKTLGNFFTLRDLMSKGFTGREIRYLLLTAHYRETFNFTLDGLQGARTSLSRIEECLSKVLEFLDNAQGEIHVQPEAEIIDKFTAAMDEDLNVSKAWGVVFGWVRDLNRLISQGKISFAHASVVIATWKKINEVLGLELRLKSSLRMNEIKNHPGEFPRPTISVELTGDENAPEEIKKLLMDRIQARTLKEFKRADAIRDELKAKGWAIEDTVKGPKLKKL